GEALMRSRRKPLGFLPNAFMATLGFSLRCKNSDRVDLARRNPPQGIIDKAEWVEPERQTWAQTALIVLRWSAQVARNESAQLGAKPRCTLAAEGPFKLILRLFPQLCRSAKPFHAGLGEVQLLAAPVSCAVLDADETVALQRQHGAAQCGAIHDQLTGKSIDGHGPEPFQLGQDRKLCGAQSYCREVLVIELSDMTRGLPQSQAVAGMGEHRSVGGHGVSGGLDNRRICAHITRICAYVNRVRGATMIQGIAVTSNYDSSKPGGESSWLASYPSHLTQTWDLPSGDLVQVRPLRHDGGRLEEALGAELWGEIGYGEWWGGGGKVPPGWVDSMTHIDYHRHMAFAITTAVEGFGQFIGVGRYVADPDMQRAEFALVLADN